MVRTASPGRWVVKRALLLVIALLSCPARADWHSDLQSIMGTEVRVTLWHADALKGRAAIDAVMAEMRRIDATYSPYKPASDLAQVNARAAEAPVVVSAEFLMLLQRSLYFSELSEGAFDITFASVGWHYDYRAGQKPTEAQQQALLPAINYRLLRVDDTRSTLAFGHPNLRIDLGGIAKGYAVDRALGLLRQMGIEHASVSAGGDSGLLGDRRGRPWLIGIKNPRQSQLDERDVVITMPLSDLAVSTSGDYERYFIDQATGERVHHILNPRTGRPADQMISATILGPVGMDTDALSTAVFVLGVERGLALLNQLQDFDGILIDHQGKVHYSQGLQTPDAD